MGPEYCAVCAGCGLGDYWRLYSVPAAAGEWSAPHWPASRHGAQSSIRPRPRIRDVFFNTSAVYCLLTTNSRFLPPAIICPNVL